MVIPRPRIAALDRKLLRDLWEMKGQALAIAAVVSAGVAMFVTYLSNFDSLQRSRASYYDQQRLGDVFASLTRAPAALESRIAAISGVETVATRVVVEVALDLPGMAEPATGRLVSIPERVHPPLNDLYVRRGRWIDPLAGDEVLVNEIFAEANGFEPGDRLAAIINGRRRWLTIVGIALSPEYVYAVRPGEMIPDRRRYGVLWMGRQALASAFDMEGGFNDVSLSLARRASADESIAALDRLLAPYGGMGAIPRRLQVSAWALENELAQLQMFGLITPIIFFGVAVFVLNIALTRALALQRAQIAALKALGYSNRALAWHYIKWALAISGAGALTGVLIGQRLGGAMINLYNAYFRFPQLDFHLSAPLAVASVIGSLVVAALGAQSVVRRAVRIPPAEAMRPEAPARYRRSIIEQPSIQRRVPLTTRMIFRNIERQPLRSAFSVLGISFAVAVMLVGLAFIDVMDVLIEQQFGRVMRQDATLSFVEPRSASAIHAVAGLPGVMDTEPTRVVPVRLRSGHRVRTLAIQGMPASPRLNRIVDREGCPRSLPDDGLVLSKILSDILRVRPGDRLQVEVLVGARPVQALQVAGLVDDSFGLQAYMHLDAVRRLLREGQNVSGVQVTVDPGRIDAFYASVKALPAVAGVALRDVTLRNFRDTMAENMNLSIFFNVVFAVIIAFGVVYNSARVSLSERARELASLRVLGFTRGEISFVLLGELAVLTLVALPIGGAIGHGLGLLIMRAFNNEVYRLSFVVNPATVATAYLVVIVAALGSGLIVRHRLDHLDLVAVLKTRE